MMTIDHERTEKTSRMSMINLPIIPACFIISKIDNSTTILPVDIDYLALSTWQDMISPFSRAKIAVTHKHNPSLVFPKRGKECTRRKKRKQQPRCRATLYGEGLMTTTPKDIPNQ
jgi:hypothetical protein